MRLRGPRLLLVVALMSLAPVLVDAQPTTTRVSVSSGGEQGNSYSWFPAISADGRWVAFFSYASNLVGDDTNGFYDVFVHDRHSGNTTRVSVGPGGLQANEHSQYAALSADGRHVAFSSAASNLVADDSNGFHDVFVHDRQTGSTVLASRVPGGGSGNGHSGSLPAISADGQTVAFESAATNLVAGDTNGVSDVFVFDRQTVTITRVSVDSAGDQGNGLSVRPSISADGRWIAFLSAANNLVFGDTNGARDVFVHDRLTGTTTRVSVGPGRLEANGDSGGPSISADGRLVAFHSAASNLVAGDTNGLIDVFFHDVQEASTHRVSVGSGGSQANGTSGSPVFSANGQHVAFSSDAGNLVPGDTNGEIDVFLYDTRAATTTRVSVGPGGLEGDSYSASAAISGNGRVVAFYSANTFVADDTNGSLDVFVRDLDDDTTPFDLRAPVIAGNLVTLRWTLPWSDIAPTNFVLEGGVNPDEVLASLPTGSADPTFTFTAPSGSFYVRVHALNGAIRSAASNEIRIHVNVPIPPSAPANLLGLVNGSTLSLAWTNTYGGGAPSSLVLDVTGGIVTSLPLGPTDSFSFSGVPAGTYTLALRAQNAGGTSPPSNPVTLTFPGPCTGPPLMPAHLFAYRVGNTVFVDWAPAATGPAPTGYVLNVTGAFVGSFPTPGRAMSGVVGPGSYTLSVGATNACGASAATALQTVVVP